MMRTGRFIMLLFCGILPGILSSCAMFQNSTLYLGEKDNGKTFCVNAGDIVFVRVPANPTTGHLWKMTVVPDAAVMRLQEETFEQPDRKADRKKTGQGGIKVYRIITVGPGRTGLRLEYRRPWETDRAPEKVIEYMFDASGKNPFLEDPPETSERMVDSKGNVLYVPAKERWKK